MSKTESEVSSTLESKQPIAKWKQLLQDYLIPCLMGAGIAWFIHTFIFFTAYVPSGSMEPTIMTGEKMLVAYCYDTDQLERGDIVVFESEEYGKYFVKRLIGKGGDKVELLEDGSVRLNGKLLDEPYVVNPVTFQLAQTFTVPDGHFFFLGDNRMDSHDARYWNEPFISEEAILGTPFLTISPLKDLRRL